jgi:ABC-type amino acid transport substrate-binding protein
LGGQGGTLKRLQLVGLLVLWPALAGAREQDEVGKGGVLRVLAVVSPGDEFLNDQPGGGLDRELLEAFATLRQVRLEVVAIQAWDRLVPALIAGEGDIIAGRFTVTEARQKLIDFTPEVFPTRHVVLTRRPHRVVSTLQELRAERVGTVKGTSLADAVVAAGVPAAKVDDGVPTGRLPDALRSGRVSAIVLGIDSAISERRRDGELQIGVFLGPPGALAWSVRKTDRALHEALSSYVTSVRRTATWNRLVVKYFGEDAPDLLRQARGEEARP